MFASFGDSHDLESPGSLHRSMGLIKLSKSIKLALVGYVKPGLHISRKDCKHRLENMIFKLSSYGLVSMW